MYKANDLRSDSHDELELKLETLRKEIYELRSQQLDNKSQKIHLIGQKRKEIARVLTIQKERELKRSR